MPASQLLYRHVLHSETSVMGARKRRELRGTRYEDRVEASKVAAGIRGAKLWTGSRPYASGGGPTGRHSRPRR
jgi:hypothetical protein